MTEITKDIKKIYKYSKPNEIITYGLVGLIFGYIFWGSFFKYIGIG